MTVEIKNSIKRFSFTVLVFCFLYGVLASFYYVGAKSIEKRLLIEITNTIKEKKLTLPLPEKKITIRNSGFSFFYTFIPSKTAQMQGTYYIVRVTGNSGPYTCLFFHSKNEGTQFLGTLGISGFVQEAEQYGITKRVISSWLSKISALSDHFYTIQESSNL